MTRRTGKPSNNFSDRVRRREEQRLDPNRQERKIWFGLGMFGVVGWSVALPMVLGAFLGVWIDNHLPSRYSWTLMLLGLGLGLGCATAWRWLQGESQGIAGKKEKKS